MVLIPSGKFTLGIKADQSAPRFMSERTTGLNAQPRQEVHLDSFYIDRYEVTYEDFMRFKPQAKYKVIKPNEPMRGVSWYEADAYCAWNGKRLPTEFEWEKAARGGDDRLFVWGQEAHNDWASLGKTVQPVGSFKKDISRITIGPALEKPCNR
jgi:formylglycine-generating enzyme required for sulfatase activity